MLTSGATYPDGMRKVAVLAYEGAVSLDLAIATEIFGTDLSAYAGRAWYRFILCGERLGSLRTSAGFLIDVGEDLSAVESADLVIVPGWRDNATDAPPEVLRALRAAYARGAQLMSICTGAFLLASAGLLDGRRATTHWSCVAELARLYPRVRVQPRVIYTEDGPLLTSAGMTAGIDLCLHVVRNDYGVSVAARVGQRLVVPPIRDSDHPQIAEARVAPSRGQDFDSVVRSMLGRMHEQISIAEWASLVHMSERTFERRFVARTGATPHRWLARQRIRAAQRLLEVTDDSMERIAERTGLGTPANFRHQFHRVVGVSPTKYREKARSDLSAPTAAQGLAPLNVFM
jgi:AraC family transcriptional activator FtrA